MKDWVNRIRTPYAIDLGEGRFEEYDTLEACEEVAFDRVRAGQIGVGILSLREFGAKSAIPARYLLPGSPIAILPAHYELTPRPLTGDFSWDIVQREFVFFDGIAWRRFK